MRVGMIGLGKLGLPVATAMASRGLEVYGYDPYVHGFPADTSYEENFAETIEAAEDRVHFCGDMKEVVANADTIFCAIQTPHNPRFEGTTPIPEDRADFDYSYLIRAVEELSGHASYLQKHVTLAVISTVLPGTMAREIEPRLSEFVSLAYNPSFIAMGTTIKDFLDPEFILLGGDPDARLGVLSVYEHVVKDPVIADPPFYVTSIPNAELIKVAYNTFIGLKLAFANTLMEVCHKTDCDVDEVTGALKLANRRLISGAYLDGGMGDGGGCHPRDNIALSWLARKLDLSYDLFDATMKQRERQAEWLADLMEGFPGLAKGILGIAYKPGSHITTGSPAVLVRNILRARGHDVGWFDPHVAPPSADALAYKRVWLIGCKHPEFAEMKLPGGSVVIDPWRYFPDQEDVEVIRLGEASVPQLATSGVGWPD